MTLRFSTRDYRRPSDREKRDVYWCSKSEFGRLAGEFTPEKVAEFYPPAYYTHGLEPQVNEGDSFLDRLRAHLAWRIDRGSELRPSEINTDSKRPLSFCDLGCGSGQQLQMFREAGYDVIGIEPDPSAREFARRHSEVLDGTAENLPANISAMQFDVVLLSHVLEHCIDPMKALANACGVLKPDGKLVIEVPNNAALGFTTFGAIWPWADIPRHLNFFTERSLCEILEKCGLEITLVKYTGYCRQFQSEWVRIQEQIWAQIGSGQKPNFNWAAWKLLFRTARAKPHARYDSIRIHAIPSSRS